MVCHKMNLLILFLNILILCSCQNMAKSTTGLLTHLRALLKNTTYVTEPLQAYIVLSEDAHQVLLEHVCIQLFSGPSIGKMIQFH